MATRIGAGMALVGIPLAVGLTLATTGHQGLGYIALGASAVMALLVFAHKVPLLHRLPGVGAPKVEIVFTRLQTPDFRSNEVFLQIGLMSSARLDDAVLNFLVPEGCELFNADASGNPSNKGREMALTSERLNPGIKAVPWADNVDLRKGAGVSYFVLRPQSPGTFKVRFKVGSERLYGEGIQEDYEVSYP